MGVNSSKGFNFKLVANGKQLDLFQDETIEISNNVTGLFDIGILPSDFTRQIIIPGTKRNNSFFQHVYDISVQNPYLFSTNVKVPAYFDFDGVYLSQGYIQLNKVNVYANKFIQSYEITIYGTLSSFSRDINKLFLTDLSNLSKYNHTASYQNIRDSWDGDLFAGDIVYPLCDYGSGWTYTPTNNVPGIDDIDGALSVQDFKPSIRVKAVLDAIFEYTGYSYSSEFFNLDWISELYMICNNSLKYPEFLDVNLENYGKIKLGAIEGIGMTDFQPTSTVITQFPWYNKLLDKTNIIGNNSSYFVQKDSALQGVLSLNLQISSSVNIATQTELHYWPTGSTPGGSGSSYAVLPTFNQYMEDYAAANTGGGGINLKESITTSFVTSTIVPTGHYYFGIRYYPVSGTAPVQYTIDPGGSTKSYLEITKATQAADGKIMNIPLNMPYGQNGIKLVDFIRGLQRKFNLVIYPDNTKQNHFIIEPFNSWYDKGEVKNFDKFINLDEIIGVTPANNLAVNKLEFGDLIGNDYIAQQFAKLNTREYGKTYYTDTQNFFSQGEFVVDTVFSNTPLTYLAGTGLSGSAEGITPPSVTSYGYYVGDYGWFTPYDACANTSYYPNVLWGDTPSLAELTVLYNDSSLTSPYNGGNSYWKILPQFTTEYYVSYIQSDGVVGNPQPCSTFI